MKIAWRKDLETGDAHIDGHHQELFQKIEDVITACKQKKEGHEIAGLLTFLKQYVHSHFSVEAQYQARHGYPLCREHSEQHEILVGRLTALEEAYLHEGPILPVVTNALKLTYEWLTWHILQWDKEMIRMAKNAGPV
jgi:hemerythrin